MGKFKETEVALKSEFGILKIYNQLTVPDYEFFKSWDWSEAFI